MRAAKTQWKLSPQAQLPCALGLSIVKPCFWMVSSKSIDRAVEVGHAHLVDDDLDAVAELDDGVAVEHALVEVELVDEAGASAGLHGEAQTQVVTTLLLEQAAHLARPRRR